MRHMIDNVKIPQLMIKLLEHIEQETSDYLEPYERAWETSHLLYDLSPAILYSYFDNNETSIDYSPELNYFDTPFEIIPFSYNGGDALNYSWVNLAPELDLEDFPCVSFAPGEGGALWLGDNTAQAFSNLLVGQYKGWKKWNDKKEAPNQTLPWKTLCELLGLEPDFSLKISAGGRSTAKISPTVPEGWQFEMAVDGIGVLAKKAFFSPEYQEVPLNSSFDTYFSAIKNYLYKNQAGSALVLLKQARSETQDTSSLIQLLKLYQKAYEQLNREAHFQRVDIWLQKNNK